ncbi:hypothetical protein [Streptomyces hydrogenans]|uniref:hypothetical protein n=1 Tax=Streptomyces hydrogenans TaxID=1873719 RepID=UPI00382F99EE
MDYTYTDWKDFGRLPVFLCPSPIWMLAPEQLSQGEAPQELPPDLDPDDDIIYPSMYEPAPIPWDLVAFELRRALGQLQVGELIQHRSNGWTLLRSGDAMWSECKGPQRRVPLRPRTGSR